MAKEYDITYDFTARLMTENTIYRFDERLRAIDYRRRRPSPAIGASHCLASLKISVFSLSTMIYPRSHLLRARRRITRGRHRLVLRFPKYQMISRYKRYRMPTAEGQDGWALTLCVAITR